MAVAFIKEITGRSGSKDVDTNVRKRRTWIVRTDRPQDGADVVLAASPVAFNAAYQYTDDSVVPDVVRTDPQAVCVDIQVSQDNANDPQDWRLVAEYAGVDDPVSQPAEVDYSPTRYQKSLVTDLDDFPVVNTAGDPFDGGITVDRTRFTLTISKPVLTWDPVAAMEYQDSVNLGTFLAAVHPPGFAPGTCKLTLSAKRVRRAGTSSFYWLRTAVIDIDKEGWRVKVRNAGMNELYYGGEGGELLLGKGPIFLAAGQQATTPQLLNADGEYIGHIAPGDPVPDPLEFRGYESKSWGALGLEY
jgi:hypothetical protein